MKGHQELSWEQRCPPCPGEGRLCEQERIRALCVLGKWGVLLRGCGEGRLIHIVPGSSIAHHCKPGQRMTFLSSAWAASLLLTSSHVFGAEKCTKPLWDPRIRFVPDQESYNLNRTVTLACPDGYRPSATEITCVKPRPRQGLPAPQSIWLMKNSTGSRQLAAEYVRCVGE